MRYTIRQAAESRSFPDGDPFLARGVGPDGADIVIHLGTPLEADPARGAVLVELGSECLGVHTGEPVPDELRNVVGFARYRNGADAPSPLIELVRRPETDGAAVAAAKAMFEAAGLAVVVSADHAGRIVDRLVRPKYNDALRFLDEGLALQADMDLTCRLGLGYPDGPVERVVRGGLAHHHDVSKALFDVYGTAAYASGRSATVAAMRRDRGN